MKIHWKAGSLVRSRKTGETSTKRRGGKARLDLSETEISALRELLEFAARDRHKHPVTWLTKSKPTLRLLRELSGICEAITHSSPTYDDDIRMHHEYRAAMRAVSPLREEISRLEEGAEL